MTGCEHYERGENCGKTDCYGCGKEAAAELRVNAHCSVAGIVVLAGEVCRVEGNYGVRIPDGAVSIGDLARIRAARLHNQWDAIDLPSYAWAEGICEALTGTAHVESVYSGAEQLAHEEGIALVKEWQRAQARRKVDEAPALRHLETADKLSA